MALEGQWLTSSYSPSRNDGADSCSSGQGVIREW